VRNFVVWTDIPVKKLDRAVSFYSSVFSVKLDPVDMGPTRGAFFPFEPGVASGALVESHDGSPGSGPLIYLDGGDDLSVPLSHVKKAGGKVLQEKTSLGEHGFKAVFEDTEGNRIALHSIK